MASRERNTERRKRGVRAGVIGAAAAALFSLGVSGQASAAAIKVEITNLAPQGGIFLTPMWVAFHNGQFDIYDRNVAVFNNGLEQLAEDGNNGPIGAAFRNSAAGMNGGIEATITAPGGLAGPPVIDPGETTSQTFHLDPASNRYFSYASMIIASNDAFIANGDPLAHMLFDTDGDFTGPVEILVLGMDVLDAGTEENTEMDAAFINQAMADDGIPENGVVTEHPGFIGSEGNPGGTPIILGGTNALGATFDEIAADFTREGYQVARITITREVPEPAALGFVALGLAGLGLLRRKRR